MCAAINIWCGLRHCTDVRFATFLSVGFITAIVVKKGNWQNATLCTV